LNQRIVTQAPGKVDEAAGEFWMENPWKVGEHNLSAYERNRVLLNVANGADRQFIDVSHLTTADIDSDSRGIVTGDFNGDGMPDAIVRSSGGGPLRVFENRWPQQNWITLALRGVQSNSLGLGARVHIRAGGKSIWRELYPHCSYLSQQPASISTGLGAASRIESLTIYWPSGHVQTFKDVEPNRFLRIQEDQKTLPPPAGSPQ